MNFENFLFLLSAVVGLVYYLIKKRYSYWKRINIPYIEPKFPFGNIQGLSRSIHISKLFQNHYDQLKGKGLFGGTFFFLNPTVLATDLDFIKTVLIKDFNYFVSRGIYYNEKDDPLSGHLFSLDGDKWKRMRSKLTSTFTSGRMKYMFPTVLSVADELKVSIDSLINSNKVDIEIKDILARFTTDIIGTCAFGIECNSLKNPESMFRKFGQKHFEKPRNSLLKILFMNGFRELARKLKMKMIADDVSEFFLNSLRNTVRYREENNVQRKDFLNLLMQLQKYGKLEGNEDEDGDFLNTGRLTFNELAAQSFLFFLAGFETSSTTMLFCLFELSVNPEIQRKARKEVMEVLSKHKGEFTYEAMSEMYYLEYCIQGNYNIHEQSDYIIEFKIIFYPEALRKYPPLSFLLRVCVKDYTVPNTEIIIPKGMTINIPIYGIHHDEKIFPNPEVYDPDRFSPDESKKRHPLAFIPFGDGPRNCIGLRFGLMQTRVGLATMLKNYEFSPCPKTSNPLTLSYEPLILTPEGGLWLSIKKIEN